MQFHTSFLSFNGIYIYIYILIVIINSGLYRVETRLNIFATTEHFQYIDIMMEP